MIQAKFSLKKIVEQMVPEERKSLVQLKKELGSKVIAEVKVEQVLGGMRNMPAIFYQASQLHPMEGIRIRGLTIPDLKAKCQKF